MPAATKAIVSRARRGVMIRSSAMIALPIAAKKAAMPCGDRDEDRADRGERDPQPADDDPADRPQRVESAEDRPADEQRGTADLVPGGADASRECVAGDRDPAAPLAALPPGLDPLLFGQPRP